MAVQTGMILDELPCAGPSDVCGHCKGLHTGCKVKGGLEQRERVLCGVWQWWGATGAARPTPCQFFMLLCGRLAVLTAQQSGLRRMRGGR